MKIFTRVAFLALTLTAIDAMQEVRAQLAMNPSDSVYTYNSSAALGSPTNPNQPATGKIGKWIRTVRMSWNTNEYKAYIYRGSDFRIHFPHTYSQTNPTGKKYPVLVFYHGDGEEAGIYDNEDQLDHGAQPFQTAIDNGTFDGFAIFMQCQYGWGTAQFVNYQALIDSLVDYYQADPYRIIQNGLSGGGQGEWNMLAAYPTYFAGSIPMSATLPADGTQSVISLVKYTKIWNLDGGLDNDPPPSLAYQVADSMAKYGANYTLYEFPTLGHDTWDSTWLEPNFWPFVNNAYESNPWPLFGRTNFCPGQTINVTIGVVPGLTAYQWSLNGTVIPNATSNTIQATQAGTYAARVMRGSDGWSNWSPIPVVITVQGSTQTPPITTVNGESAVLPDAAGDTTVTLQLPTGDSIYTWKYLPTGATVGTSPTLTVGASKTGDYIGSIIPYQGCSSIPSPAFPVVKASGPNPPPPATTLVATPLGFTSVRLTWSAAPNPTYPPTAYEVYRGTKSGIYKLIAQAAYDSLGYTDATATAGTTYFYVVRAVDTTGAAALSNVANTMTTADVTPPTAPGNLQVVATTNATATLSWTASTDNVGVDHYAIYVNGQLAMVTQNLSIIVNGLNKGQVYTFYVKAVDASGNYSNPSNQASAPIVYNGLSYSYYTTNTAWTDLPNFATLTPVMIGQMPNVSIANATQTTNFGYQWIGYITIPVAGTYTFETTSDDGSALWFNTLVPGSTSTATVNNDGQHGSTTVKSKALTLTAGVYPIVIEYFQAGGGTAMTVSWSCSQLFGNTNFVAIANKYFAANYTPAGTAPAKPTAISAQAASYNQVNVSWTSNSTTQTGFEVYRATSLSGPWAIVGTTGANATSFTDVNQVQPGTKYYYKVQAINQYGGSGYDTASIGGLLYNFYQGVFDPLINYDSAATPVVSSGIINNFLLSPAGSVTTDFGFLFAGRIHIPKSGTWTFYTTSDDASELFVNGYQWSNVVVNNNFQQGMTQRSGTITLAAGTYPFYVAYEQTGGGFGLNVAWANTGAGIAQSAIPDSAFYYPGWTTTTAALPPAPVTPTILKDSMVTNSTSRFYLSWQDTTSTLTGYTLYRSANDTSHFNVLALLKPTTSSYTDTALFGHTTYYYRLVATGAGGNSTAANVNVTTPDNPPVFAAIASPQFLNYTKTGTVNVNVTDADGDVITLTASGLPSFATFTPGTANGTGTLTFSPASQTSNEGSFSGITLTANDGHGRIVTDTFTLVVNNDVAPVFNPVKSSDTVNAGSALAIPITVTDANPSDVLTFSFKGLPANSVLSPGANGTDTLKLNPNYGDAGNYTVVATVNDGNGGITSDTFHVVVIKVSPAQNIYVQFSAGDVAGAPWNVMSASGTATGFLDSHGNKTTVGLNFQPGWWITYNNGPVTGNNSGVYPDKVEEDYFFFGSYPGVFSGPSTDSVQVTGLNPAQTYSLTFYSGSVWVVLPNNGTTTYSCQGQSGSLAVQDNTQNTVTFSGLKPNANGVITFTLGLGANTQVGYLNAVVINSTYNDGTAPLSPSNLAAGLAANGAVQLNWYDSAYNETGYYILRSQSPAGPFVQLPRTVGAGVTSYVDSTSGSNRTYYYEVQAFNSNGVSNVSNIASVTTNDRVPTINPIANVNMTWTQMDTVTITTTADTTNMVSLTATGLPPFATFTDNGNGTATVIIQPTTGATGVYPTITVTSTDQMDSVRTATFSLIVRDPSVTSTYIHLSDGTNVGGTPWNNYLFWPSAGNGMGSLVNDQGATTSMAFTFKNGMAGSYTGGMQPHNGAGIFPDPVMRSGDYESGSQIDTITLSGLQQGQAYNIVFFNSVDYGGSGITNFYANGKTVTLNPAYNINNTVRVNDVLPNASGNIYLGIQKVSGQSYAFLNDLIIENYDSSLHLLAPTGLLIKAMNTNKVTLQWQVRSSGETAEQVWRGTDSSGSSYQLIATLAPGTSNFVDSTVQSNRNYYYTVCSVNGTTQSNFSNAVYANPYAYLIYLSYSVGYTAPSPWNNIGIQPTLGQVWYNFSDASGNVTNTGQVQTGTWGGIYAGGMQTGNNSGVVPDAVMIASYGLFPGTTGSVMLTGLDLNMTYDVTFFGSANLSGDNNATYTANGKEAILNATYNETGEVTIFNVAPDAHGNITITCTTSDAQSQFALMNAVILQAHSLAPSGNVPGVPAPAAVISNAQTRTAMTMVDPDSVKPQKLLNAYPNAFHDQFTLVVPVENMSDNIMVTMFDASGRALYQKEFDNLTQGNNYLLITPVAAERSGVYFVRVLYSDQKTVKFIKMLRQ